MRIVNRAEFLAIVGSVLYTKIRESSDPDECLCIKVGNAGNNDWHYNAVDAVGALECGSSEECADKIYAMERDPREVGAVNFATINNDGLYEGDEVKFVVFDRIDVERLSNRILQLLVEMK